MSTAGIIFLGVVHFFGALEWAECDIEGIRVGGLDRLSGQIAVNFLQADLNADGRMDLVFDDSIVLANEEGFSEKERVPLPVDAKNYAVDVDETNVFVLYPDKLVCLSVGADSTIQMKASPIHTAARQLVDEFLSGLSGVRLGRYLFDFHQDGQREMVVVGLSKIAVLQFSDQEREWIITATVVPEVAPRIFFSNTPCIWPRQRRKVALPLIEYNYSVSVFSDAIMLMDRVSREGKTVFYSCEYPLHVSRDNLITVGQPTSDSTYPLPATAQPCRLSQTKQFSYVVEGLDWFPSKPFQVPVHECSLLTSQNEVLFHTRTVGSAPHCLLVDVNGDGLKDVITETMHFLEGDSKEILLRALTSRTVEHTIAVYLQRQNALFPSRPDFFARFSIDLGAPVVKATDMFQQYRNGEILNLLGDFTKDGFRDLLVKCSPTELVLYPCFSSGFSKSPAIKKKFPAGFYFDATDVNGDGRADLILRWPQLFDEKGREQTKVFLTKEVFPDAR